MRKVFVACMAALLVAAPSALRAQEKTALTDRQIISGDLPEGIFNRPTMGITPSMAAHPESMPPLVDGWENPTYSPDKRHIAYTLGGDLYTVEVATKRIQRHTSDGSDVVKNGFASWVYYEEIFGRASRYKAFWWSPDSKVVAFYRFDESRVPMFPIYDAAGQHGSLRATRYPKAGDPNPEVKIGFVSVDGNSVVWSDFDPKRDQYFGTPFWDYKGKRLIVPWLDRSQDNMIFYSVDPLYGSKESIYSEHQATWVDWPGQMLCSSKGIYMVRDYEMWQRIYFLSYDGKTFRYASDRKNYWGIRLLKLSDRYLFFTARGGESSLRTDIYRVNLNQGKTERISFGEYDFTQVRVSDDDRTVYATLSNCHTPPRNVEIRIPAFGGVKEKNVKVLYDAKGPLFDQYKIAEREIVQVTMRDGSRLPAAVIWPVDMDRSGKTKYPVKVDIYGGPDHQMVYDRYAPPYFGTQWWANHGVVQVVLDTRSAGHLGKAGVNTVYRCLGVHELEDFIDGIKYFTALPYIDSKKVGIEGYSFGGTMALLAATEGNEYFQYAVASSGVIDWTLYDSHYTERYMDTPRANAAGYAASRVLDRLDRYRGDETNMIRLTHGTGDDNVHFQNSLQLIDKLQSQNKDFEFMAYPGGMHGYRGYQDRHFEMQNMRFWYKYLLGKDLPEVLKKR